MNFEHKISIIGSTGSIGTQTLEIVRAYPGIRVEAISAYSNIKLLEEVVDTLAAGIPLPEKYRDHKLTGNYKECRECHITPDWLLIYEIAEKEIILYLTRTGTHSDLF